MEEILDKIGEIAKKHNVRVYAVGGSVRDILLGEKEFGIDIAVEGDGIEFGKILQKELGGKLRRHQKFGTASLILPTSLSSNSSLAGGLTIDLASCREEEYPESAKLPEVKIATLQEDLKRRDFTINAMALNLETKELIDPFGGKEDLDKGLIRILHPKSFIDDPTRIFRALRFAGRFGFKIESETELLAKEAIKDGLIKKLTPKRIRNEIILIIRELNRWEILGLMNKFGILRVLKLKLPLRELFKRIDENFKLKEVITPWFVYLLGIIDLKNPPVFLGFTRKELQRIERAYIMLSHLSELEEAKKPSEIYKLLKGAGNEELLFVASYQPKLKLKILRFLEVYKKVKLEISGKDLTKVGIKKGPLYRKLLTSTLYAKLDGKVCTKKEELEFVKTLLRKSEE